MHIHNENEFKILYLLRRGRGGGLCVESRCGKRAGECLGHWVSDPWARFESSESKQGLWFRA